MRESGFFARMSKAVRRLGRGVQLITRRLGTEVPATNAERWTIQWVAAQHYAHAEHALFSERVRHARTLFAKSHSELTIRYSYLLDVLEANEAFDREDYDKTEKRYLSAIAHVSRLLQDAQSTRSSAERKRNSRFYSNVLALLHSNLAEAIAARNPVSREVDRYHSLAINYAKLEPYVAHTFVCRNLGNHYRRQRRWSEAESVFREAARAAPGEDTEIWLCAYLAAVREQRASALEQEEKFDEAISVLEDAQRELKETLDKLGLWAKLKDSSNEPVSGDSREVAQLRQWRRELRAQHGSTGRRLAELLHKKGREAEALAHYESSAASYATSGDASGEATLREAQGDYLGNLGQADAALNAYDAALAATEKLKEDWDRSGRAAQLLAKSGVLQFLLGKRGDGTRMLDECRQRWLQADAWGGQYAWLAEYAGTWRRKSGAAAGLRAYYDDLLGGPLSTSERREVVEGLRVLFADSARESGAELPSAEDDSLWIGVVNPITIEIDMSMLDALGGSDSFVQSLFPEMRKRIEDAYGVKVPGVRLRWNESGKWPINQYVLSINEVPLVKEILDLDRRFCAGPLSKLQAAGIEGGQPEECSPPRPEGFWIERKDWPKAEEAGVRLWELSEYPVRRLERLLVANLTELVGHQEVRNLLDTHKIVQDDAQDMIAKEAASHIDALTNVVRCLLSERVPITDFPPIYAVFERMRRAHAPLAAILDEIRLLPEVRPRLWGNSADHEPYRFGQCVESELSRSILHPSGRVLALASDTRRSLLGEVRAIASRTRRPVIVTLQKYRAITRSLLGIEFPELPVVSLRELLPELLGKEHLVIDLPGGKFGGEVRTRK